jgi:hypothetical protein
MSAEEVARRIESGKNAAHSVWKAGMSEWADASSLEEFSGVYKAAKSRSSSETNLEAERKATSRPTAIVRRARRELIEYLGISAYLYLCLGSVLLYKAAILRGHGIEYAVFGVAMVKALILGKFLLVLHGLKVGERGGNGSRLWVSIISKSLLFAFLLVIMTLVEELVMGFVHGRTIREVFHELAEGTVASAFASAELLLLILIPYFGFREISASLGEGALSKLLMERRYVERRK